MRNIDDFIVVPAVQSGNHIIRVRDIRRVIGVENQIHKDLKSKIILYSNNETLCSTLTELEILELIKIKQHELRHEE